jgi:hypothetical protein
MWRTDMQVHSAMDSPQLWVLSDKTIESFVDQAQKSAKVEPMSVVLDDGEVKVGEVTNAFMAENRPYFDLGITDLDTSRLTLGPTFIAENVADFAFEGRSLLIIWRARLVSLLLTGRMAQ